MDMVCMIIDEATWMGSVAVARVGLWTSTTLEGTETWLGTTAGEVLLDEATVCASGLRFKSVAALGTTSGAIKPGDRRLVDDGTKPFSC